MTDDTKDAVLPGMVGAVRMLQTEQIDKRTGFRGDLSTFDMARILERESGYREMYEALVMLPLDFFEKAWEELDAAEFKDHALAFYNAMEAARTALRKARGEV